MLLLSRSKLFITPGLKTAIFAYIQMNNFHADETEIRIENMAVLTFFLSEITTVSASENCAEQYCSQSDFLVIKVVQMTIVMDD